MSPPGLAETVDADAKVRIDADGRLHTEKIKAVPDPPSLTDLRRRVEAMLPGSTWASCC